MNQSAAAGRDELRSIARRAMIARGLLPDFSPAVLAETEAIGERVPDRGPASATCATSPGRRSTTTTRATSTSSRSPRRSPGGAVTVLVAIADVDALVAQGLARSTATRAPTRPRSTRRREIFPMLPERLSTDLTSLGEGRGPARDRRRDARRAPTARSTGSDVYRAPVRNHAKLAYDARRRVARRRRRRRPATRRRGARRRRAAAPPGPRRAGAEAAAPRARRARPRDDRGARRCSTATRSPTSSRRGRTARRS